MNIDHEVGAKLPQTAAANDLPDALLVGAAPDVAPTPLPVPVGPSFEWSKTDNYKVLRQGPDCGCGCGCP